MIVRRLCHRATRAWCTTAPRALLTHAVHYHPRPRTSRRSFATKTSTEEGNTEPPTPATSRYVVELTEANIHAVLSRSAPVLIDCYADWCEPCRSLTPILEKVVAEHDGAVILGKLNVDTQSSLVEAMALPVQSIPSVFIVMDEQFVASWTGLKPVDEVRKIVRKVVELKQQTSANPESPSSPSSSRSPTQSQAQSQQPPMKATEMMDGAQQALQVGDFDRARQLFQSIVDSATSSKDHRAMKGKALTGIIAATINEYHSTSDDQMLEKSRSLLAELDAQCQKDRTLVNQMKDTDIDAVKRQIALAEAQLQSQNIDEQQLERDAKSGNVDALHSLALRRFQSGDHDAAVELALELLRRDKVRGRELLLALFDRLGPTHPLVARARKRMAALLFA